MIFIIHCPLPTYLHSKNMVHRDISTRNILITLDMREKLCGFGVVPQTLTVPKSVQNANTIMKFSKRTLNLSWLRFNTIYVVPVLYF